MADSAKTSGMDVDTDLVRQLAELLDATSLSEIEVEDGDRRIRVARQMMANAAPASYAPPPPPAAAAPVQEAAAEAESAPDWKTHPGAVKSPMVGTVYLASEPGAARFIEEGVQVAAGDTLLIVEAMKVMNPITAPRAGTVRRICVANEQPVEYDEVLAIVD